MTNQIVLPNGRVFPLNLQRSGPDRRDFQFVPPLGVALPATTDLRGGFGPIVDQGQENSCTGNQAAPLFAFNQRPSNVQEFVCSRRFAYWDARTADGGSVAVDQGASIRGAVAGLYKFGIVPEFDEPYVAGQYFISPSAALQQLAQKYKATGYRAVALNHDSIVGALAAGKPVIYGFAVYQPFESIGVDGLVPAPAGSLLGYHANVLCGHFDGIARYISRNCWGTSFGDQGYIYQRMIDIHDPNYAFDAWVLDGVTGDAILPAPSPLVPMGLDVRTPPGLFSAAWNPAGGLTDRYELQFSEDAVNSLVSITTRDTAYNGSFPPDGVRRFMRVRALSPSGAVLGATSWQPYGIVS